MKSPSEKVPVFAYSGAAVAGVAWIASGGIKKNNTLNPRPLIAASYLASSPERNAGNAQSFMNYSSLSRDDPPFAIRVLGGTAKIGAEALRVGRRAEMKRASGAGRRD